MKIILVIPGPPCGKQRARTFLHKQSGRAVSMTPAKTVNAEAVIRETFGVQYPLHTPWDGPVNLYIAAYFPIPKSASKNARLEMLSEAMPYAKRPDADNIAKLCADALNGVLFRDDSQVWKIELRKFYSERPRLEIMAEERA